MKVDTTSFVYGSGKYMGNDQLLPCYNVQIGICDEYIEVTDVQQFTSDMDCFVLLMNRFNKIYGFYPEYPVADAVGVWIEKNAIKVTRIVLSD